MNRLLQKSLSRQFIKSLNSFSLETSLLRHNNIITRGLVNDKSKKPLKRGVPPRPKKAVTAIEDSWVSVKDESSGQIYWWNQQTDETTALGAPKPIGPTAVQVTGPTAGPLGMAQQSGGMMSGIGGTIAHGMAFGVGSSIAHNAIGSMFGGGSSHSGGGGDGGSMSSGGGDVGGSDEWDI